MSRGKKKTPAERFETSRRQALTRLMEDRAAPGDFRLVLRWWLEQAGTDAEIVVQAGADPVMWALGRRSMGVWMREEAEDASPSAWLRSQAEGQPERGVKPGGAEREETDTEEGEEPEGNDDGSAGA